MLSDNGRRLVTVWSEKIHQFYFKDKKYVLEFLVLNDEYFLMHVKNFLIKLKSQLWLVSNELTQVYFFPVVIHSSSCKSQWLRRDFFANAKMDGKGGETKKKIIILYQRGVNAQKNVTKWQGTLWFYFDQKKFQIKLDIFHSLISRVLIQSYSTGHWS